MKTKGVAVQTIIMIMLGVVVLLFVGYWLVRVFSTPALSEEACRSIYIDWCRNCALNSWTGTNLWGATVTDCLVKYGTKMGFPVAIPNPSLCSDAVNKANCGIVGISI
jgi:hypothetical protein